MSRVLTVLFCGFVCSTIRVGENCSDSVYQHAVHWLRVVWFICRNYVTAHVQKDCPNGQLTRAKFLEVYSSFFPQGNAEKFCEHVFRTFDSDNSGKIDFKEFLLAINITSTGKPEQKLEWAFQMYDVNGDGTIEPSEMQEIIGVSVGNTKRSLIWYLVYGLYSSI